MPSPIPTPAVNRLPSPRVSSALTTYRFILSKAERYRYFSSADKVMPLGMPPRSLSESTLVVLPSLISQTASSISFRGLLPAPRRPKSLSVRYTAPSDLIEMSLGPLNRLPPAPSDSTVCLPSFSRRMTLQSSSAHQRILPCGSTPEHDGPISSTCERPARVCAPTLSGSSPVYPAFSMKTETAPSAVTLYSTLSSSPPTSRKPPPPGSRTHVVPSSSLKPFATSSTRASRETSASKAGSARVKLNGCDLGAGPSPRIPPNPPAGNAVAGADGCC